jgi:hypothetical protein
MDNMVLYQVQSKSGKFRAMVWSDKDPSCVKGLFKGKKKTVEQISII